MTPAEWCCENLTFDEPDNHGPFTVDGREYLIEPLNAWARYDVTDITEVTGSQIGKTTKLMGGAAYTIRVRPSRIFWVMPNDKLASDFSSNRWMPLLRASKGTKLLVPKGAERNHFKTGSQRIGGSIITFHGSNSPTNLSSTPARVIIMDEADKFDTGTRGEANAVNLAEQRAKRFSNPLRICCSTPSMVDRLIWPRFLKGDQRRYYVPCWECKKMFAIAWSEQFTLLPTKDTSFIVWDKEAKREDGSWDMDRVFRSARVRCCHCGADNTNERKRWQVANGEWRSSVPGNTFNKHLSYHLPSMYAQTAQTAYGSLAMKFIAEKLSLTGLQGFINGELAEPFEGQDIRSRRVEMIVVDTPSLEKPTDILTVDVQEVAPFFWWVVRSWSAAGDSSKKAHGSAMTWEDIERIQKEHQIEDGGVFVDSNYDTVTVYERCLQHGNFVSTPGAPPVHVGWHPMRGREYTIMWREPDKVTLKPYMVSLAPLSKHQVRLPLIEFNGDFIKDILQRLREGKTLEKWMVQNPDPIYWKHLDGEVKRAVLDARTGRSKWIWVRRNKRWPNHILDCEVMQVAAALFKRILKIANTHANMDRSPGTEQNPVSQ